MSLNEEIANWEVFTWALHDLGGDQEFVDVETVFVRCFELAPKRFSWRTREDLPDYKKCSKALRDAEARRPALFVKTGEGLKRQLSVEGQVWARDNDDRMREVLLSGHTVREPRTRPRVRTMTDLTRSDVFRRWQTQGELPSEKWRMAEVLRCSPDSSVDVWRSRLELLRSAAFSQEQVEVLEFLDALAAGRSEWFDGEEQ